MPQKQGGGQKSRTPKFSQGEHGGGGKVRLNNLEKVLIAKPSQIRQVAGALKMGADLAATKAKEKHDQARRDAAKAAQIEREARKDGNIVAAKKVAKA